MTQHDNILIVAVPEDAYDIAIVNGTLSYQESGGIFAQSLPPGPWRIVGRAKELTEGQWDYIIPDWIDHTDPTTLYPTPSESGQSLLLSHGIEPESNPLILIKEK